MLVKFSVAFVLTFILYESAKEKISLMILLLRSKVLFRIILDRIIMKYVPILSD
jgi:hypothetical protein